MSNRDNTLVFDFTTTSLRDSNRMDVLNLMIQKAQRDLDIEALEAAQLEIIELILKAIVSIPSQWLESDAPKNLTFNEPDDLLWLQTGKLSELTNAMSTERDSIQKK